MSTQNNGGPAFPVTLPEGVTWMDGDARDGMSLRDYFAAQAMASGLAGSWRDLDFHPISGLSIIENNAACAYRMADAMLKARES